MKAKSGGILGGLLIVATIALAASLWPRSLPDRSFAPDWTVGGGRETGDGGRGTVDGGRMTVDGGRTQDLRPETGNRKTGDAGGGTVDGKGFRTRAMSGMAGETGRAWAQHNGLTPRLAFSHHLAAIFPPSLHAEHPEFFPLVNGERMRPRDGAQNWNPDLGREDVAAWAADAARRHFDANPGSESFSVGVNDGLIFGDNEETMAALRVGVKPESGNLKPENGAPRAETGDRRPETEAPKPGPGTRIRENRTAEGPGRNAEGGGLWTAGSGRFSGLLPSPVHRLPSTVRWFRGRPDLSNLVFEFTNRVAAEVARTHPDKYVGALAYYWCENAPDFPLHPNVIPFLTADRSQGYDEAFRAEELTLQRRWASVKQKPESRNLKPEIGSPRAEHQADHETHGTHENQTEESEPVASGSALRSIPPPGEKPNREKRVKQKPETGNLKPEIRDPRAEHRAPPAAERANGEWDSQVSGLSSPLSVGAERRLGLYDYLYGSGFLIPRVHTRLIADNLRQARRLGFTDYYAEVNPNWGLDGPMPWLVAQLLQDPEQSREVLLEEYYCRNFEEAAVPMRRFFERCERQWMHQPGRAYWLKHYRNESQARLFPSAVCRELRVLLEEAARQARAEGVKQRVRRVGDAFGVTERFVMFCEARDALNREGLNAEMRRPDTKTVGRKEAQKAQENPGSGRGESGPVARSASALVRAPLATPEGALTCAPAKPESGGARPASAAVKRYHAARKEFIAYTRALVDRDPGALAAFRWEDYLRHEPPTGDGKRRPESGGRETVDGERWTEDGRRGTEGLKPEGGNLRPEGGHRNAVHCAGRPAAENLLSNGDLRGALQPPKQIGGLVYGVAMPEGWITRVEPAEGQRAHLEDGVLRLERNKETFVYQWLPATGGAKYRATVRVRGCVQPSATASLTLSWLDERQTPLGIKIHRLPEGAWTEWVTLEVAQDLPAAARWIGTGVRVQHQLDGDWLEAREFCLEQVGKGGR